MGLRAIQSKRSGAWRLWELARALDEQGSGVVYRSKLQSFVVGLGVPGGTFRRLLADAKREGFITQIDIWNGEAKLVLTSAEKVAKKLGCSDVGTRRVQMPANLLTDDGWRGSVWAAFISTFNGRPVSRSKMKEITGIPERTQQEYEKQAGIKTKVNYAHDESKVDPDREVLADTILFDHYGAFKWYDRKLKKFVVVWRCPDSRKAPMMYTLAGRGRSRKVNNTLSSLSITCTYPPNNYSNTRRAGDGVVVRLFHYNQAGADKSWKRYAKLDIPPYSNAAISEMYVKKPGGKGCQQWSVSH